MFIKSVFGRRFDSAHLHEKLQKFFKKACVIQNYVVSLHSKRETVLFFDMMENSKMVRWWNW